MSCELAHSAVHGYFDGELDAVRAEDFENHLETCAECQGSLEHIDSLRRRLQQSALYHQASPQLRARVRQKIASERPRVGVVARWRQFLVPALAALTIGLMSAAFFAVQSHRDPERLTSELLDAHVRSLQPGHLTDVQSTDQHTVKPWFDGKLDFIPPVTDHATQGFPLIGGRLDVVNGRDVAALVYSRRKHIINVFVWPLRDGERPIASTASRQGYNWILWSAESMQFCVISDVSPSDLQQLRSLMKE
ncbi:MAG TPA: anti-sigma factor [Terriglobales bacterium]